MLENVEWGEYLLKDLFSIQNTLSFNKDSLTIGTKYHYVTRTSQNQGVLQETGWVNKENINNAGVWSLGLLQMDFFYRTKPWYAGQFVRKIVPKFEIPLKAIGYFTTLLNKQKPNLLSVLVRNVDDKFNNTKIQLPTKNNNIDFDFMQQFTSQLEQGYMQKLDAYLAATGLKDYHLTDKEKEVLGQFEKWQWGEFKISTVFEKLNLKNKNKTFDKKEDTCTVQTDEFNLPLVNAKFGDNGIMFFGRESDFDSTEMVIDVISNGAIATGTVYAQPYRVGVLWDAYLLKVKEQVMTKQKLLCLTTCLEKSIKLKFGWDNKAVWSKVQYEKIQLPTTQQQPDYELMQTFISAVQKLVIRSVVEYADSWKSNF